MARTTITKLVDDLDGSDADRTVEFALDGIRYEIDLSEQNAGTLRKTLDPYLVGARRIGRTPLGPALRVPSPAAGRRDRNQTIREWARRAGHDLAERGRIPRSIVAAYDKAH